MIVILTARNTEADDLSVLKSGKSVGDCVRSPSELPMECQHLISNFSDCKKGMVSLPLASPVLPSGADSLVAGHASPIQRKPPVRRGKEAAA